MAVDGPVGQRQLSLLRFGVAVHLPFRGQAAHPPSAAFEHGTPAPGSGPLLRV